MKATTKPVEVEAVQWRGDNEDELHTFVKGVSGDTGGYSDGSSYHMYGYLVGHMIVRPGYWLVRTTNLGVSAMSDEAFRASYDLMPEPMELVEFDRFRGRVIERIDVGMVAEFVRDIRGVAWVRLARTEPAEVEEQEGSD